MAAPTITQVKQFYKDAIELVEIGKTFAIRDYILYLIYANTYESTTPSTSGIVTKFIKSTGTTAQQETAVNAYLAGINKKFYSLSPYTDSEGEVGVIITHEL